jgi:hypothetical protein
VGPATPTLHWTQSAWTFNTADAAGYGYWSPEVVVAADGTVYAFVVPSRVVALAPDGTTRWTAAVPVASDARAHETGGPATSLAIGVDGTIYAYNGDLTALHPDGTMAWTSAVTSWPATQVGVSMSLTVGPEGTIYVADAPPTGTSHVHAIAPGGAPIWTTDLPRGTSAMSSPSIGLDGTILLVTVDPTGGRMLLALRSDGSTAWTTPAGSIDPDQDNPFSPDMPPVVGADGTIFAPCGTDTTAVDSFCSFAPDGAVQTTFVIPPYPSALTPAPTDQAVYASANGLLIGFGADGTEQWSLGGRNSPTVEGSPPILDGRGTLYLASGGNTLSVIPPALPQQIMVWPTTGAIPVAMGADGTVYGVSVSVTPGVPRQVALVAVGP